MSCQRAGVVPEELLCAFLKGALVPDSLYWPPVPNSLLSPHSLQKWKYGGVMAAKAFSDPSSFLSPYSVDGICLTWLLFSAI